jgi:hypothetical protein
VGGTDVSERVDEGDVFLGGVGKEANDGDLHDGSPLRGENPVVSTSTTAKDVSRRSVGNRVIRSTSIVPGRFYR